MMKKSTKDINNLFFRNREVIYKKTNVQATNIEDKIKKESKSQEEIYIYQGGTSANFVGRKDIVDKLSINYLQIYDKDTRNIFNSIKKLFKEIVGENNINEERLMYYITSQYEQNIKNNYWYDNGGDSKMSLCGYYFIKCEEDSHIYIDSNKIQVNEGDLILFFSGNKIVFNNCHSALSFNISPLNHIKGQYPQKWMPL